jgi:branched-chain amino acid transport system substrate-binding protein
MKVKKLGYWILVLGLLAGFLVGCGATEEPAPVPEPTEAVEEPVVEEPVVEEPVAEEVTMVIGFTTSQTGNYNVSSLRQVNGFLLWMNEVNDAGGVQLSDGTVVKFDYVTYDDESTTERVQELYTRLATEDNADLLISPYSSGLTAAASPIAEQYEKIIITTGAASDSNYTQGYTRVFQAYTPSSRYLTGAVDMLAHVDPDVTKVAFVYENDKFSTDVVNAAKEYATEKGYDVVLFEGYDSETKDFGPFINKILDAGAEAIMGGGHFQDGSTFARQVYEKDVGVNFFALLVAPPEPDFADLGDAAVGVIGPSQWEPLAAFTPESAAEAGLEWFGALGADFVSAYEAAYDQEPSYHSMGGYGCHGHADRLRAHQVRHERRGPRPADRPQHGLHPVAKGRRRQPGQAGGLAAGGQDGRPNLSFALRNLRDRDREGTLSVSISCLHRTRRRLC